MSVRTRIAPSPTGDPHVGTAYVALFNYVFARSQGGQFLLRIEDTDRARSTQASENMILDSLRWLGLSWDEGPDVGGAHAPYRQSERGEIYARYAQQLIEVGAAFHCFCSTERLTALRTAQQKQGQTTRYDGHCKHLSAGEVRQRLDRGEAHVVRLDVPVEGVCTLNDLFRGEIEIPWTQVDMQVLLKSDGMPTYHLAAVVDDHLYEITHILRGEEWINSAPKHLLLFKALNWQVPLIGHLPLLRNPDRSKLSKRKNPTSVNYYRDMGYLPEALLNFLGMLGGLMPADAERLTLDDMIARFDLKHVSLGAPIFDIDKLDWLNGLWLRNLSDDAYIDRLVAWRANRSYFQRVLPLLKERVTRFSQVAPLANYLLGDRPDITEPSLLAGKSNLTPEQIKRVLLFAEWRLGDSSNWQRDEIQQLLSMLATQLNMKLRDLLTPIFVAIGGRAVTLPLFDSMELLGRDLCRQRLRSAAMVLGALSGKELSRLEKEYSGLAQGQESEADQ